MCHYSKLNLKFSWFFFSFEATICPHECVTCQIKNPLCGQTRHPETNSDLLIWPLVRTSVAVGSLEWSSVVSACLPAPSRPGIFWSSLMAASRRREVGGGGGGGEQEIKATHKQSPSVCCLIMTSITRILSGCHSHFPIMNILLLGFATALAVLDIHVHPREETWNSARARTP